MKSLEEEIFDYCCEKYNNSYLVNFTNMAALACRSSRAHKLSATKKKEIESASQLQAIKTTIIEGREKYPNEVSLLWGSIYKAHLYRKSGISDRSTIDKVISADQSWKSSSGHAFEAMISELGTLAMSGTNFRYILQKDLNLLLEQNKVGNKPTDVSWLKEQVRSSVFDIYVVADVQIVNEESEEFEDKVKVFGCAQCKTSIRDRVSRDIVPSREAMESQFWNLGFVLDGEMFSTPKYINMVNGNPESEFKKNGWHGFYVLSPIENIDRIYPVDLKFDIIRKHTIKAFNDWDSNRVGFTREWRAD